MSEEDASARRRDANALRDEPNRGARLRAVRRLAEALREARARGSAEGDEMLHGELIAPLLRAAAEDKAEACREAALEAVREGLEASPPALRGRAFPAAASLARARTAAEPSEELRLAVARILTCAAAAADGAAPDAAADAVAALVVAAADPFPDLKVESARAAAAVAALASAPGPLADLGAALLPNLRHQRSRVRETTLGALSAVVLAAGAVPDWLRDEAGWAQLSRLQFDRAPAVRLALVAAADRWLAETRPAAAHDRARLVLLVVGGAADEIDSVRAESVRLTMALGSGEKGEREEEDDDDDDWPSDPQVTAAFAAAGPPPPATRRALVACLPELFEQAVAGVSDWTASARGRSSAVLHALVVLVGEAAAARAPAVLGALRAGVLDDEEEVRSGVLRCARAMAWFVSPSCWLRELWTASCDPAADSGAVSRALLVLSTMVRAARPGAVGRHAAAAARRLCAPRLASHPDPMVRLHVAEAVAALVARAPAAAASDAKVNDDDDDHGRHDHKHGDEQDDSAASWSSPLLHTARGRLFWAAHQLGAAAMAARTSADGEAAASAAGAVTLSAAEAAAAAAADAAADELAAAAGTTAGDMYAEHFGDALALVTGGAGGGGVARAVWERRSAARFQFVHLVERGKPAVAAHLPELVPVLAAAARPDGDPALRMDALHLLALLLDAPGAEWGRWAVPVLRDVVQPNAVWRAGRAAAAIRLQAVTCAEAVVRLGVAGPADVDACRAALLPVLASNLDDEDAPLRLASVRAARRVFETTAAPVEHAEVTDLCRALLKRLDDSSDAVRVEAVGALGVLFARCVPPAAEYDPAGTHFTYAVKTALVHLDDPEPAVHSAVLDFLAGVASYAPKLFEAEVRTARDKHSTPDRCDALLRAL